MDPRDTNRGSIHMFRQWEVKREIWGDFKTMQPEIVFECLGGFSEKELKHLPLQIETETRRIEMRIWIDRTEILHPKYS